MWNNISNPEELTFVKVISFAKYSAISAK